MKNFYTLLDENMHAMIEASTNTFKFVELIRDRVREVFIANIHELRLISMVNKKTDRIDAEKLAILLKMQLVTGKELIKPVYIPKKRIQDLRSLFTSYILKMVINYDFIPQMNADLKGLLSSNCFQKLNSMFLATD
ncbi:MAG: hypothetical protein SVR08_10520 [Spirochaetota bacterium]|nr:hypothetical protein [Spirochaetota bacterium]